MRLYLLRRTRGFIKENYAETDPSNGRKFLTFDTGERFYFPIECLKPRSSSTTSATLTIRMPGSIRTMS